MTKRWYNAFSTNLNDLLPIYLPMRFESFWGEANSGPFWRHIPKRASDLPYDGEEILTVI